MAKRGSGRGGTGGLIDGAVTGLIVFGVIKVVDIIADKVDFTIPT